LPQGSDGMGHLSSTTRSLLLVAALANFGGHVKGPELLTSTAELNRCLTAVRVALSRRGVVNAAPSSPATLPRLGTRPARRA
jgi:hypothetical protein